MKIRSTAAVQARKGFRYHDVSEIVIIEGYVGVEPLPVVFEFFVIKGRVEIQAGVRGTAWALHLNEEIMSHALEVASIGVGDGDAELVGFVKEEAMRVEPVNLGEVEDISQLVAILENGRTAPLICESG